MHYPAYSPEAARFLLEDRLAVGLGTDTHGLDPADDEAFTINRLVLRPGGTARLALECLANLDQIPPVGAVAVVGALLLAGGTGSPAAVLRLNPLKHAILDNHGGNRMNKTVFFGFLTVLTFLFGVAAVSAPLPSALSPALALITPTPTPSMTPIVTTPGVTATPSPTSDPVMDAWCLPKGTVISRADLENAAKPAGARLMKLAPDGTPIVITVDDACFFSFTFTKAAPSDLTLEVYDALNYRWLTSPLKPADQPETVFTALTHGYIVDPPFWLVDYTLKVVDPSGAEKWSSKVSFRRGYEPGKCYDGSWPDPVTWYCYTPPDPHPWDFLLQVRKPTPIAGREPEQLCYSNWRSSQ